MFIKNDIIYVGVNDKKIDLFEGLYDVPNGMAYNSYIIMDDSITVFDTVDAGFTEEWLTNIKLALNEKSPKYLIIQHMEPDHSSSIMHFLKIYPNTTIVSSAAAFKMMKNYFGTDFVENRLVVTEGSEPL